MFYFEIITAYSIIFAAIIGIIRFKKIHSSYRPFVVICVVALLNETLSFLSIYWFGNNSINYNVYLLVEAMLYMWLFRKWGHFDHQQTRFKITIFLLSGTWIVDELVLKNIHNFGFIYMTVYSFTLVFMAITEINEIIMSRKGNLLRDSQFLICASIVIFYSYFSIIAIFWISELHLSMAFYANLYLVLQGINILINIVFAFAVLWAPQRLRFILQF